MATHQDSDALDARRALVEKMTREGTNKITAGELHGEPFRRVVSRGIEITRLPADASCLRISIGKPLGLVDQMRDGGGYFVFRGDMSAIRRLLGQAIDALHGADQEQLSKEP